MQSATGRKAAAGLRDTNGVLSFEPRRWSLALLATLCAACGDGGVHVVVTIGKLDHDAPFDHIRIIAESGSTEAAACFFPRQFEPEHTAAITDPYACANLNATETRDDSLAPLDEGRVDPTWSTDLERSVNFVTASADETFTLRASAGFGSELSVRLDETTAATGSGYPTVDLHLAPSEPLFDPTCGVTFAQDFIVNQPLCQGEPSGSISFATGNSEHLELASFLGPGCRFYGDRSPPNCAADPSFPNCLVFRFGNQSVFIDPDPSAPKPTLRYRIKTRFARCQGAESPNCDPTVVCTPPKVTLGVVNKPAEGAAVRVHAVEACMPNTAGPATWTFEYVVVETGKYSLSVEVEPDPAAEAPCFFDVLDAFVEQRFPMQAPP